MKLTVDISANNTHPINFGKVRAAGVSAVLIKATEGTGYVNPYFAADRSGARAAGLEVAAYHFARFGSPAAEATHFRAVAGADAKILDIETSSDTAWADAFLAALNEPSQEEMTYGSASSLPHNIDRGLLWPAAYGPNPPGFGQLWQNTQTGQVDGIDGYVDVSEWLGTTSQWDAFFGITPPPPGGFTLPPYLMAVHPTIKGAYWLCKTSDGSVESFGGAVYHGGGNNLLNDTSNIKKMSGQVSSFEAAPGDGYYIVNTLGQVYGFAATWSGNES